MTVQEIQEIGFEKAVFGGYDMKSVDTFLERVAEEFAAMQKENAAMKAKMKVLVDKIEEYRGVEEGMHRTLLTAQSIAQETIDKAKKEAEEIIASAKDETANKVKDTQVEINTEEQKLETARKNTAELRALVLMTLSFARGTTSRLSFRLTARAVTPPNPASTRVCSLMIPTKLFSRIWMTAAHFSQPRTSCTAIRIAGAAKTRSSSVPPSSGSALLMRSRMTQSRLVRTSSGFLAGVRSA